MGLGSAFLDVGRFLLEHFDLISEMAEALASGAPKDAIRAAIREAKIHTSDQAMKEELGL